MYTSCKAVCIMSRRTEPKVLFCSQHWSIRQRSSSPTGLNGLFMGLFRDCMTSGTSALLWILFFFFGKLHQKHAALTLWCRNGDFTDAAGEWCKGRSQGVSQDLIKKAFSIWREGLWKDLYRPESSKWNLNGCHPHLPFVWPLLLLCYCSQAKKNKTLQMFFKQLCHDKSRKKGQLQQCGVI